MAKSKENRVLYIYTGVVVSNKDKKRFCYMNTQSGKEEWYNKKLSSYETVGTVIEVTSTETGVSQPYTHKGKVSGDLLPSFQNQITEWSIRDRANLETLSMIGESKKEHPKAVKELIKELKQSTLWNLTPRGKKLFALWVYNELIK